MVIDLKYIFVNDNSAMPLEYELDLSNVEYMGDYPLKKPVCIKGTVSNKASLIRLKAQIFYEFEAGCDRCGCDTVKSYTLELDKSLAERTVKPFVIGRKNFLFSNTPAGADASCILYSIVETAKLNKLIPYEYLKYVMDRMSIEIINDTLVEDLLPWSKTIPDYVKNPSGN